MVHEDNRALGNTRVGKAACLRTRRPGNSMWLDHTPPALSQQRDGWCRRAHNQLYSPFVLVCPISDRLDQCGIHCYSSRGPGVGKLAGLVQRVGAASLTHTAENVAN